MQAPATLQTLLADARSSGFIAGVPARKDQTALKHVDHLKPSAVQFRTNDNYRSGQLAPLHLKQSPDGGRQGRFDMNMSFHLVFFLLAIQAAVVPTPLPAHLRQSMFTTTVQVTGHNVIGRRSGGVTVLTDLEATNGNQIIGHRFFLAARVLYGPVTLEKKEFGTKRNSHAAMG